MWPFLMLLSGAFAAGLILKAVASWSQHRRWRSGLQGLMALPLACVFAFTLLQFWEQPLDFFYHATGFSPDWQCSYVNRGDPICIKNN